MNFNTVQIEGSLISADLLEKIYIGEAAGQKVADFNLKDSIRLNEETAACWAEIRDYWKAFQRGLARVSETDSGASVTREQWMLPLLRALGFDNITFSRSAAQVGGQSYFISHRLGNSEDGLPIHIEGARNELDKRPEAGRPRISPHALVQEYLNRTEHLWGIVTNGYQFRILRNSARLSRPTYLEFDLQQMLESEQFSEFQLFYRLAHRSRWPLNLESAAECWLEKYYTQSIEEGGRVREHLRDGVENALLIFGNGFLNHPDNQDLVQKLKENKLTASNFYRQLLKVIYRYLFLMVSEERKLIGPDPGNDRLFKIYSQNYSISRLREKVERPINQHDRYWDLWEGVKQNFLFYCYKSEGEKLGIAPLNGDLFGPEAMPDLETSGLFNNDFLKGFANLSLFKDGHVTRRINYAFLDVEELGSVYESLLDFFPFIKNENGNLKFELNPGSERKSTGSYYTRPELVHELIKSALDPVIEERVKAAHSQTDKIKALLSLKVCDIAVGSGHFLLAAARRIGKELAKVRTGEEQPTPVQLRQAVREVIQHCIYGVDLNPLAVDLCKVALWLEGHNRGMPLTFLDHRIRCGNSLVGLDTMARLKAGIPDEAFEPVTGDVKDVAKKIKALNRQERQAYKRGQMLLPLDSVSNLDKEFESFVLEARSIDSIEEKSSEDVHRKQETYLKLHINETWFKDWTAANIWTAAFFYPLTKADDPAIPTFDRLMRYIRSPRAADGRLVGMANELAVKHRFFHWPLEFPEIFEAGGFDVILGNPPWERIKLQEQEFFAVRDYEIAHALNKAERTKLIKKLPEKNPALANEFALAQHEAESNSRFVRNGARFPLTAVGDINTFSIFAELSRKLISSKGRTGIIVPTGIATDDTCKQFFDDLNIHKALVSLFDFENKEGLFPGVHRSYKFCLLTTSNKMIGTSNFAFFLTKTAHLNDQRRLFSLSPDDIALINANTRTVPVFRTQVDAALIKKIYQTMPILENERTRENFWGIRFSTMFHMANDSHLFSTTPRNSYKPLYEAKMFWQFDHRFGTYEGVSLDSTSSHLTRPTFEQYSVPSFTTKPMYWIDEDEVLAWAENRTEKQWLLVFRDVTNATNERTIISSLIPLSGVGHTAPIILLNNSQDTRYLCCFLANVNSLVTDFVTRNKIGGMHLTYFIFKQIPIVPPLKYSNVDIDFIVSRVLELVYNSYDLMPFAEDLGYESGPFEWDEERRSILRAELDAYYAHLYSLTRDELRYILDPKEVYGEDFPGETFRVLKDKEIRAYGEYRTRRLVLEAWDRLFGKGSVQ
jgi:hypothetical protein